MEVGNSKIKNIDNRIHNFFNVYYKAISFILILFFIFIYCILYNLNDILIQNNYIILVIWSNQMRGVTHIYMIIIVWIAMIYLINSYFYLKNKTIIYFNRTSNYFVLCNSMKNIFINKISSGVNSKLSLIFSIIFIMVYFIGDYHIIFNKNIYILYINKILFIYFELHYLIIAYLVSKCFWIYITYYYFIFNSLKIDMIKNINALDNWIRKDIIGGIKHLSNLSVEIIKLYIIGVLMFTPAPFLYKYNIYYLYSISILLIGSFVFLIFEYMIHKKIVKEKYALYNLFQSLDTQLRIDLTFKINQMPEWTIDIKTLLGILISNLILPIGKTYLSNLLDFFI